MIVVIKSSCFRKLAIRLLFCHELSVNNISHNYPQIRINFVLFSYYTVVCSAFSSSYAKDFPKTLVRNKMYSLIWPCFQRTKNTVVRMESCLHFGNSLKTRARRKVVLCPTCSPTLLSLSVWNLTTTSVSGSGEHRTPPRRRRPFLILCSFVDFLGYWIHKILRKWSLTCETNFVCKWEWHKEAASFRLPAAKNRVQRRLWRTMM